MAEKLIDYDAPGVPVFRAVYCDAKGRPIWTDDPYPMSRLDAVGDFMVHNGVSYTVEGVAVCEGTMYVNLEKSNG